MTLDSSSQVWMVGGGIATMAAATFLIRDAAIPAANIHFLEQLDIVGGSMDGARSPIPDQQKLPAYDTRGGRMFSEEVYQCLWNLLSDIPTLDDPEVTVYEEFLAFYQQLPPHSRARIVNSDRSIADASSLGLNLKARSTLLRLLTLSEHHIGAKRISDYFDEEFFASHFWTLWRTTFAFQNWHSAVELKRYFHRFLQEFGRIDTLAGVRRSKLNQYDSIIRPVEVWLEAKGVDVRYGTRVENIKFTGSKSARRVSALQIRDAAGPSTITVGQHDYVITTLGSITADATFAGDTTTTHTLVDKRDASWTLWQNVALAFDDFGKPDVFCAPISETQWKSFTLTMHSTVLLDALEKFSGNVAGEGNLITWHQSSWLLSIVVPAQPHFRDQLPGTYTLWGYALHNDTTGDYVDTSIQNATGTDILEELLGHLGFDDQVNTVTRQTSTVTHVQMPYIDSLFQRRQDGDRPAVVPVGAENFAFVGQFVEIPDDTIFTVEYSVHAGMIAAYQLAGVTDKKIPPLYNAMLHPDAALKATRVLLSDHAKDVDPTEYAAHQRDWRITHA